MHEAGLDISEEFYAYKERASGYIARASHFPFQWGLPNGAKNKNGFPIEFFRWDRRVLKRMVDRAEHIIRCLIIWMAWARLRSGLVEPVYSPLLGRNPSGSGRPAPSRCSCGAQRGSLEPVLCELCSREQNEQGAGAPALAGSSTEQSNQNAPVHHLYSIRGLPLYDLRVAPFTVSLPAQTTRSSLRTQGSGNDVPDPRFSGNERNPSRSGRSKRIRNDKVFSSEVLIMRMERLGKLYEEIDTRAARIAGLWLGRMKNAVTDERRPKTCSWDPTPAIPNEENSGDGWQEHVLPTRGESSAQSTQQLSRSPERASGTQEKSSLDPGASPGKAGEPGRSPSSRIAPHEQGEGATALSPGPDPGRRSAVSITPIKSPDPPPDMMEGAPDDERDDVLALHDGAIRAAELFTQHCV